MILCRQTKSSLAIWVLNLDNNLWLSCNLQSKNASDLPLLWKSVFYSACVLAMVSISCEFGQQLTNSFDEVTFKFKQLGWYLFPTEVQQMLPIILIGVQKPMVFGCFSIVKGSREQLKKVKSNWWKINYSTLWLSFSRC